MRLSESTDPPHLSCTLPASSLPDFLAMYFGRPRIPQSGFKGSQPLNIPAVTNISISSTEQSERHGIGMVSNSIEKDTPRENKALIPNFVRLRCVSFSEHSLR
jgi:hypothetical protein